MKRYLLTTLIMLGMATAAAAATPETDPVTEKDYAGYLFAYFTGNHISQEAICFAVSYDGFCRLLLVVGLFLPFARCERVRRG